MDLTPFFHNVERIATALETIARNTTPVVQVASRPLLSTKVADEVKAIIRGEEVKPAEKPEPLNLTPPQIAHVIGTAVAVQKDLATNLKPKPTAVLNDFTAPKFENVIKQVRGIMATGVTSANGVAKRLIAKDISHPRGNKWNNLSAKVFIDEISRQDRAVAVPAKAEPAKPDPEPDPAPPVAVKKPVIPGADHFRERNQKRAAQDREDHMNMTGLLSPQTKQRLGAFVKARDEGKSISDATLIADAIAAGKVKHLPACTGSDGYNHLKGAQS